MSFKAVFHARTNYQIVDYNLEPVSESEDEDQNLDPLRDRQGERRRRAQQMRYRAYIHPSRNYSNLENLFADMVGLDSNQFMELYDMLNEKLNHCDRLVPGILNRMDCLVLTLRFLSSGLSIQTMSQQFYLSYAKILRIIRIVCKAMAKVLVPRVMPRPTRKMWQDNAIMYDIKYMLPNCIGAIEGKNLLVNGRKVVFMTIVDANGKFVMVDLGMYGKNPNCGHVLENSMIGKTFTRNEFDVPEDQPLCRNSRPVPFMLIGSSLFPAKPYLMTKYSRPECEKNIMNRVFNKRMSYARLTLNKALLQLRHKWKVFQGPIQVPLDLLDKVVLCCCCLQNLFNERKHGIYRPKTPVVHDRITDEGFDYLINHLRVSNDVRDEFKKYFLTTEGHVSWQWQGTL